MNSRKDKAILITMLTIFILFIIFFAITTIQVFWIQMEGTYHGAFAAISTYAMIVALLVIGCIFLFLAIISKYKNKLQLRLIGGLFFLAIPALFIIGYVANLTNAAIFHNSEIIVRHGTGMYLESVPKIIYPIIYGWIAVSLLIVLIVIIYFRSRKLSEEESTPVISKA